MKLYIIRHGKSPSIEEAKVLSDAERPISEEGRKDVAKMAEYLVNQNAKPEIILSSPLRRAFQTARELAVPLHPPLGVKRVPALNGASNTEDLWEALNWELKDKNFNEVALVGHQPQLAYLVEFLTQGPAPEISPGTIVALEIVSEKTARLLWSKNP